MTLGWEGLEGVSGSNGTLQHLNATGARGAFAGGSKGNTLHRRSIATLTEPLPKALLDVKFERKLPGNAYNID